MFKRILIVFCLMTLVVGFADARKKKAKSGTIEDGTFTDSKYNFSMIVPDGWSGSTKKDKDNVRLVMTKKQYDVPMAFLNDPNYTKVPKVTVMVDSTNMKVLWFVDSILAEDKVYKSKLKKRIMENCEILYGDFIRKQKGKMSIGDNEGIMLSGELKYTKQIPNVYTNYYGGSVFFLKKGDQLIVFHFICENLYFDAYYPEFVNMIKSFVYSEEKTEDKK